MKKAYNNLHAQLAKDFGKLTTNQLIVVEKHNGADVLLYQVAAEKKPAARFVYLFKLNGEKPLLNDFSVMLPQQKEAAKEEAKNKFYIKKLTTELYYGSILCRFWLNFLAGCYGKYCTSLCNFLTVLYSCYIILKNIRGLLVQKSLMALD